MNIKSDALYTVKEASNLTGWSIRKLQRKAKKDNQKKIDGRYLFYGRTIQNIILESKKPNVITTSSKDSVASNQLDLEIQSLQLDLEHYKDINTRLDKKIQSLQEENKKLKEQQIIPHQEKLKEAIQLITLEAMEQNVQHKIFTEEEYQDVIGTLSEVNFQKQQVQYLKNRIEKQDEVLTNLSLQLDKSFQDKLQRNFIDAKEKGFEN